MEGSSSDDPGFDRSLEGISNGIASMFPSSFDTDDDDVDDDCGPKPSELYGKYTWKIEKFSQINKRELRSNVFEVGGSRWYILFYPQGRDLNDHISLFLCVANHEKLIPGWSQLTQFTIAVCNKDPRKSKYSDTLHCYWKKEHDWGWRKYMQLSKLLNDYGFLDADTLTIKVQVQVIRKKADRPFRCLESYYRSELAKVYMSNVEEICHGFVVESRGKIAKVIEDKVRWSSFCKFWRGMEQKSRHRMSSEKSNLILELVVKQFFKEGEVTTALVMESLYGGLKAIKGKAKSNKARGKCVAKEVPISVVMEDDTFILVYDAFLLFEREALKVLPPCEEKDHQNCTKYGGSGVDYIKDSVEHYKRRLTELGHITIETFVVAHIFSKIDIACQEAVALKIQRELIREEEEARIAQSKQKAKHASKKGARVLKL